MVQCENLNIPFLDGLPEDIGSRFDIIVDAIFGFSFKGDIRAPFDTIIKVSFVSQLCILCAMENKIEWRGERG